MNYFKIFNESDKHNGFQYVDGLNIDSIPFNDKPYQSYVEGGFYFSDAEYICEFLDYGNYIREVSIPDDAKMVKDPDGNKWRTDKLFLHERKDLKKVETWEWMIKQGINIHVKNDSALRWSASKGHIDVVKFLVENGADIHADNNNALRCAVDNGHIDVVKFLVENGADIHADNDESLRCSAFNGHIDIVKFLVENGANIHAENDYALRCSAFNGHIDIVKFLVENGADIHADNDYVLRCCVYKCHTEIIDYLKSSIKQQKIIKIITRIKNKIISIIYKLYHRIK
jgi:ankyrin repeat protein